MSARLLLALCLLALAGGTSAQAWPAKPIRLVSPWAAGGPAEALARIVGAKMSEALGQPITIDSRGGANGTIGTAIVARAPADGYTILLSHLGPTAIAPALMKEVPYDVLKDFEPVTQVVSGPTLLIVRNDIPARSVRELIDHAKSSPGKLTYGSVGIGSTTHLAGEMLNGMAGIDLVHVPYKGSTPVLVDMLGGQIAVAFIGISGVIQQVQAGKFRALAISTLQRSPNFPDIPAVAETLPGFELNSWYGMMVPAGTPKAIVTRLHQEVVAALKKPDVQDWLKANGLDGRGSTPEEHAAYIRSELTKWAKIVRDAKIQAN